MTAGPGLDLKQQLPPGWRRVRLGEVGRFESGGTPRKENPSYWGGKVPFLTGADITEFLISARHARAFLTDAGFASEKTAVCTPGTVLVVTRTRVGRAAIASEMMGASQDLTPYVCGPDIDPEYACRYLLSISDFLLAHCRGATIQGLTREFVEALEIPLPPLPEQKRIAATLNEQMAAVQRARAAGEAQLAAAKGLPSAYLRAIFNSTDTRGWPRQRLGDILQPRKEVVHPRDKPSGRARFVGMEHIESGTGLRTGSIEIEMSELTGRKPRFYRGDIVYGYLRPYLNKVWIAEFDGLCSVDQYVYSAAEAKADPTFVAWFMRSPVYFERAPIGTTPGQLPRIRIEEVAAVELDLPPLSEQRRISIVLAQRMAALERLRKGLEAQLNGVNDVPAALLRRAFSGQL